MHAILVAVGVALSALAGVIATVLFEDRIADLLVRLGGRRGNCKRRRIGGCWYSIYWHRSVDGHVKSVRTLIRFRQLRERVVGESAGENLKFRVSGTLEQATFLTATWQNEARGSVYKGACQLIAEPEGDALVGRWVGWNKKRQVGSGSWVIVRLESKCSSEQFAEMLKRFEDDTTNLCVEYPSLLSRLEQVVVPQIPGADVAWREAKKELTGSI